MRRRGASTRITGVRTLLLADGDPDESSALAEQLREAGYHVDHAPDVRQAVQLCVAVPYSIVVTDLDLPGGGGMELIRRTRDELGLVAPPVFVLSRRDGEIDRVVSFEVGAVDYLARPFYLRELLVRLHARERRTNEGRKPRVTFDDIVVDLAVGEVAVGGRKVSLTPTERALLAAVASRGGAVVTRDVLLREVWAGADDGSRTLDKHMSRLREKLGERGELLQTVRGVGVRLAARGSER